MAPPSDPNRPAGLLQVALFVAIALLAALYLSWRSLAAVDFLYPVLYEPAGIGEHIDSYGPKNRYKRGFENTTRAERQALILHTDRRWSEHLGRIADLREGIHLLRVGGRDPLTEFTHSVVELFREMRERIDDDVLHTLRSAEIGEDGIDLDREGLRGPSSTWTYLVNDDPFRDQLGIQLGMSTGYAAAAALYTGPLLILWGLYNKYVKRRTERKGGGEPAA